MEKTRVLIVGDSLANITGLSYVGLNFLKFFIKSKKYEVQYAVITGAKINNENMIMVKESGNTAMFENVVFHNIIDKDKQKEIFEKIVTTFKPHIVFTITDPWHLEIVAYSSLKESYYWIMYTTLEVPFYTDRVCSPSKLTKRNYISIHEIFKKVDLIIPVTNMGKQFFIDMKFNNVCTTNIYNGLDIDKKCNLSLKKSEIFKGQVNDDDFLFMTMGVNSERKMLDHTLLIFSKFLKTLDKPEKCKLYLHSNVYYSFGGTDLVQVIYDLDIGNNIIALGNDTLTAKEELYKFYKVCDCYMAYPGGEGFSYGFAESMMHGKPVIYSNYGGHPEFATNGGLSVKIKEYRYAMKMGIKWGITDVDDAVDIMMRIYKDEQLRKDLGNSGEKWVKVNLDWSVIYGKLNNVLEVEYHSKKNLYGFNLKRII